MSASETTNETDVLWAVQAARAADAKGGEGTVVLDVGDLLAITAEFVITSGRNGRQVRAIVEDIEQQLTEAGGPKPKHIEGRDDFSWVLMDYGDFVVHVFDEPARDSFDLERLWSDVPRIDWVDPDAPVRDDAADG